MIAVVDFKAEHLNYLIKTGITDRKLAPFLNEAQGPLLEKVGGGYTILQDGLPVAVGGVYKYWETRGEAWLLFGKFSKQNFVQIFKVIKKFLSTCPIKRIEMLITHDWKDGHRWASLLGFSKEAETLRSYMPDGRDVSLYALVRE